MNTTLEQRKEQAKEYMKQLKIYKPYIDGLMNENNVCYYEGFGGFWAYQNEELNAKIKEIERAWNVTVYAVTHEFTKFGECYSMLVVGDYPEEWEKPSNRSGSSSARSSGASIMSDSSSKEISKSLLRWAALCSR